MGLITIEERDVLLDKDIGHKVEVVANFKAALSNLQHTMVNTINPFMRERIQQKIEVVEREIMAQ